MKKAMMVAKAAKPLGPYSHAVIANGFVYVSGQGPANPQTGLLPATIQEQVKQTLENIKAILEGVGSSLEQVVKVNAYLSDVANFGEYNQVYRTYFTHDFPARTTIGCTMLEAEMLVEIDCVAVLL